jgi:DNA-binding transcriptional LysR family regulator
LEVQGRIMIGAPDDYIGSLLPDVLRKFSSIYPRVTLELICAPSTALAPMLTDNKIDMAFFSRGSQTKGSFIRFEPMVWAGNNGSSSLVEQTVADRNFREGMRFPGPRRTEFKGISSRLPYCV